MEVRAPIECGQLQAPSQPPASLRDEYLSLLHSKDTQIEPVSKQKIGPNTYIIDQDLWGKDGNVLRVEKWGDRLNSLQRGPEANEDNPSTWNSVHQKEFFYGNNSDTEWVEDKQGGKIKFKAFFSEGKLTAESGRVVDSNNHNLSNFSYQFDAEGNVTSCAKVNQWGTPNRSEQTIWQKTKLD